jgi:hypothetical protein
MLICGKYGKASSGYFGKKDVVAKMWLALQSPTAECAVIQSSIHIAKVV